MALFQMGRMEEALAQFERALQLDPRHAPSWANKATCERELGRPDEALLSIAKALELEPSEEPRLWFVKGGLEQELGRDLEAAQSYDRYIQLAADEEDAELVEEAKARLQAFGR